MKNIERRLARLEGQSVYTIRTLADFVILRAWASRGDPRMPKNVEWDPTFKRLMDESFEKTRREKK